MNDANIATSDVVVIGAGIVGLACAWAALHDGARVTVIDRDFEGDRASHGNAGGIAVTESTPIAVNGLFTKAAKWLMDPLGPLALDWKHLPSAWPWFMAFRRTGDLVRYLAISHALARLNNRVYDDLLPMLRDIGAEPMHYRRGALTVYETDAAFEADQQEWALKRELGVQWSTLKPQHVLELEPSLAPVFRHGVFLEDWSQIGDPLRLVTLLRECLRALGARFVVGAARAIDAPSTVVLADGQRVTGRRIVVAAGAWAAPLAQSIELLKLAVNGEYDKARALYRALIDLFHLDTHVNLVQYIKLAENITAGYAEYVKAPRLVLEGEERQRTIEIVEKVLANVRALAQ